MADRIWCIENSRFVPNSIKDLGVGVRPTVLKLIEQLDTASPAFVATCDALIEMRRAGVDLDESAVQIAIKLGQQRCDQRPDGSGRGPQVVQEGLPARLWAEEGDSPSIVYYIRRGKLIKIGTTIRPEDRFRNLVPDEILAWEPGGRREEALRHKQFAHLRQGGEYFRPARDLLAHCRSVRRVHGDPDPRWRTGLQLATEPSSSPRVHLPAPDSPDLVTATQAADILGIKRSTIASWVRRKLLTAVDGRTRPLYYLDHVKALDERRRRSWAQPASEGNCGEP